MDITPAFSSDDQENTKFFIKNQEDQSLTGRAFVQENLKHLQEHSRKKKIAQDFYYSAGKSPLLRKPKKPVRERLGNRIKDKQNVLFGITDMSCIPPKKRIRKTSLNSSISNGSNALRIFRAQNRINKIRQEQSFQLLSRGNQKIINSNQILPKNSSSDLMVQVDNPNAGRRFQIASKNKIIRLRRSLPQDDTDFLVQVNNSNCMNRFQIVLDPKIQQAIGEIQARNVGCEQLSINFITPSVTAKTLDWRFTEQA